MNGTALILDFDFIGPGVADLPKITERDALESSGTLLLLDMTHPLGDVPRGLPGNGSYLPNLFAAQAKALGCGETAMKVSSVYDSPSHGRAEMTRRGGIHAVQESTQTEVNHGFQVQLPSGVTEYMRTKYTNSYYISQWGKTTVPSKGPASAVAGLSGSTGNSFAFLLGKTAGGGQTKLGVRIPTEVAGAPNFRSVGVTNFHVDFHGRTSIPAAWGAMFEVGNFMAGNSGSGQRGLNGGQVFYRGYIEDLTVSGRTYAEVEALDLALYTKEVLTPGGRYYGDS